MIKFVIALNIADCNFSVPADQSGINGNIAFTGSLTLDNSVSTATTIIAFVNPIVFGSAGNYTNIPNSTPINWTPFTFNPSTSILPFWTYTNDGIVFRLNSMATTIVGQGEPYQNLGFLALFGSGIAHITGFADTPATWSLSTADPSIGVYYNGRPEYTFQASFSCAATNIPAISASLQNNNQIIFKWNAIPGLSYQMQTTTNLLQTNWNNFGSAITITNSTVFYTAFFTNSIGTNVQQFYRVIIQD